MFITGFQALGAPIVKRYNLEAMPLGYIIVGDGSTAAYVGQAHAIPAKKSEVAVLYALAAQYMGMNGLLIYPHPLLRLRIELSRDKNQVSPTRVPTAMLVSEARRFAPGGPHSFILYSCLCLPQAQSHFEESHDCGRNFGFPAQPPIDCPLTHAAQFRRLSIDEVEFP
jgi:hypothetical protein